MFALLFLSSTLGFMSHSSVSKARTVVFFLRLIHFQSSWSREQNHSPLRVPFRDLGHSCLSFQAYFISQRLFIAFRINKKCPRHGLQVWNGLSLTCLSSLYLPNLTPCSLPWQYRSITPHLQEHTLRTKGPHSSGHFSASQFVCGECIQLWVNPHAYTRGQRHTLGVFFHHPCLTVLGQNLSLG